MANQFTQAIPHGTMQLLQNQRQLQNGSPKMAPNSSKQKKINSKKTDNGTHTGDVVSDESEDSDDEGDSSADEDDDDPHDGFALSGAPRIGNGVASRLAGLSPPDAEMLDHEQAIAGAEQSDEDYGGVDDLSDGEDSNADDDEETNVLRSAEKDLIAEFERTERPRTATAVTNEINDLSLTDSRRPSAQSEDSQQYDDLDLDFNEDPFRGLHTNDRLYQEMVGDAEGMLNNDLSFWRRDDLNEHSRESSAPSSVTQKRVRFDDAPSSRTSSMSSSEEDPRDSYPDLFDGNDDPLARHQMFVNDTFADAVHDNESVYDFEDEFERVAYEIDQEESDSNSDISDYSSDSDDGDTTDEEDGEVLVARVKAMRNAKGNASTPASTPNSAPSTPVPSNHTTSALARSKTANGRLSNSKTNDGRPRMGTFTRDPTKARVEADIQGSGVKVTCPPNPPEKERAYWERARKAMGSRDGSPNGSMTCVRSTPRLPSIPQRPFTAKSTLGTMFDGNLDFLRNNDENGIAKELLAARNSSTRASFTSTTMTDDSTANSDNNVNMEDFVQLDDSDSDMEEPQSASVMSPGAESSFDGDFLNTPQSGSNANLLGHFDQYRGLVSSFRNNQNHARHVSSLAAHPAKRAQTSEANALQKGRRAAANTPMTPARKNRASQDITGAGIKKVASPLVQKHRRSRGSSLSGIQQTLAVDRFAGKTE